MRKFKVFCFALLVVATLAGGGQKQQDKKVIIRFGHLANETNPWHLAALKFEKLVEEGTNNGIDVQVYPNEQLGNEAALLNGIKSGVVDMTITGEAMQNFDAPLTAMLAVPYLVQDSAQLQRAMDGEPGKRIERQITENLGFYPIAHFERGPRNLTSNRPISSPSDLKGMILRVPNAPLYIKFWEGAGAKPTPMAFSEVFTALQQGTVEGQENPLSLIYSANFFEVQKYVNLTEHVISWIYVVIGKAKLESLPKEWQDVIIDAGKQIQSYEHELFLKSEKELKQTLIDKGMIFNPVDKKAFAEITKRVIYPSLTPEQQELYDLIEQLK